MGSHSLQGQAVLVFLVAFLFLAMWLFGGNFLYLFVFLVGLAGSIAMFLKAKPLEDAEQ